jgi:hypothetical protein
MLAAIHLRFIKPGHDPSEDIRDVIQERVIGF